MDIKNHVLARQDIKNNIPSLPTQYLDNLTPIWAQIALQRGLK